MAKRKARPVEDRRKRFAAEYLKDLNATQAAIRCGYAKSSARVQGSRLITNAAIAAEISAGKQAIAAANDITIARTMKQISRIAYADIGKLYDESGKLRPLHELDEDARAQIAGLETFEEYEDVYDKKSKTRTREITGFARKLRTRDMGKALDQCMAILGMHKTVPPGEGGGLVLNMYLSDGKRVG